MAGETDLSPEMQWFHEGRAGVVVKNLQKRNMNAQYVATSAGALAAVLAMVPEGAKVVCGDSLTVEQVGVIPALIKRNKNTVINPFERQADGSFPPEVRKNRRSMMREAFSADVFLAGTNAVTLDGILVNTDGLGNRVAPMIYGPEKVILVIGANKIVKDVDEAMARIHHYCAPINARRHVLKHQFTELSDLPCVRTGRCFDCSHEWRICRATVIIEGSFGRVKGRVNVVLVGEELGI